jgi:hypothetical protein
MVAEIASPESRPLSGIAALAETVRRARSGHKQQDQHCLSIPMVSVKPTRTCRHNLGAAEAFSTFECQHYFHHAGCESG